MTFLILVVPRPLYHSAHLFVKRIAHGPLKGPNKESVYGPPPLSSEQQLYFVKYTVLSLLSSVSHFRPLVKCIILRYGRLKPPNEQFWTILAHYGAFGSIWVNYAAFGTILHHQQHLPPLGGRKIHLCTWWSQFTNSNLIFIVLILNWKNYYIPRFKQFYIQ